jgi:hypothetical protein
MTEQNNQDGEPKLYAGKFQTVEELEAGYKNSLPTFQENETLKKQLEEVTKIPDVYMNPSDVADVEATRIADIQARAKEAGMTQAQYDKFVRSDKARLEASKASFENMKKEVGEQTLNILTDYVGKNYPKELQDNMLRTFIVNKDARTAALNHRSQLLNNQVPGMNRPAQNTYNVTDEDVKKAYANKEKNPHDLKARQAYINLVSAQATQNQVN